MGKPDNNSLTVTCSICEYSATVGDINSDVCRFHLETGDMVTIGKNADQESLNNLTLICECCSDEEF